MSESWQKNGKILREQYVEANKALVSVLQDISDSKKVEPSAFIISFDKAFETTTGFLVAGYDELDLLLDYRIASYKAQQDKSVLFSLTGALAALLFFILVVGTITKPLMVLTKTMQRLAKNDLTDDVPYASAKSEIGAIASSIQFSG